MKKWMVVFLTICLLAAMPMSVPAASAAFVFDTKSDAFSTSPQWFESGVVGYDNTVTVYYNDDGWAMWQPELSIAGTYKVSIWNVTHSTNNEMITGEVKDKNGVHPFSFQHKGVEAGFVELGEFEFDAGKESGYVKVNSGPQNGNYTRVNCVKYELEGSESGGLGFNADVPQTGEDTYQDYARKPISSKDVELPEIRDDAVKFYVSPGSNGDGSEQAPFGTLQQAQQKVRQLIQEGYPDGGIGVYLKAGSYVLDDSFTFTSADSGTEENPVIWQAMPGETVSITAGKEISKENIRLVEDGEVLKKIPAGARGKVYQTNLSDAGIPSVPKMDLKNSKPYVFTIGNRAGRTARWPNVGYGRTGNVVDTSSRAGSGDRKKGFTYEIVDPETLRWKDASQAWLNGYWLTPYTIDYARIALLDPDRMVIAGKEDNYLGAYGNARYYVENLIEELDDPGEWYLDNETNLLYFYPYDGFEKEKIAFAYQNFDLVKFEDASNVILRGVKLEVGGGNGVTFSPNSSNCALIGKEIINVSGIGAKVDGKNNYVRDLDISYTGAQGISVVGGDEYQMISGNNYAENNKVHDVGTGGGVKHGITLGGCGNAVRHNHVYNILTHGISGANSSDNSVGGGGMMLTVEYNIVERTNLEMGDTGAIYFINPAMGYGSKIRYNIVRDSVGILPILGLTGDGAFGIYLDNATSGFDVTHNIMINMQEPALFSNAGRENKFANNLLINCDKPIVINETAGVNADIGNKGNIMKYPIKEEPLKSMYPRLAEIESEFNDANEYADPKYNEVYNNIAYDCGEINVNSVTKYGGMEANNRNMDGLPDADLSLLTDLDFDAIRKEIPEFEDIPVAQIGIYHGGAREDTEDIVFDNRGEAFYLTYPENGATDVDPDMTFSWSYPKGGVKSSKIYVADNDAFENVAAYNETTSSEYQVQLDYGKTYYWRVQAYPMLGYEPRWNEGGIYSFTTMTAEEKLAGEIAAAECLLSQTQAGDGANQYPPAIRAELERALDAAKTAQTGNADQKEAIQELGSATETYLESQIPDQENLMTMVYDDYTLDEVGQRPLGMFMRSYTPLDGYVQTDPLNNKNKVVRLKDGDPQFHFTNRYFESQNGYLEAASSILPMQTDASFSVSLLKTGINPVESGTINDCAAKVVFSNDGYIYADQDKKYQLMPYQAETWYRVLIELRLKEKVYDVSINGQEMAKDVPIYNQTVSEVNQIAYDTLNGTTTSASDQGTFYFDNTIVRASVSPGRNPYLMGLKINGADVTEFAPGRMTYYLDMTVEELKNAEVEYEAGKGAVVQMTDAVFGKIITVLSADYKNILTYYLKAK